ncbi:MAG: type II secretion system F family protein [Rhodococcus sp. (in: high G+C Gram-positive bacteria)]
MVTAALVLLACALLALPPAAGVVGRVRDPLDTATVAPAGDPLDVHASAGALDLMSACLRAGLDIAGAASAVADVAPEPMATALRRAARVLVLGGDPGSAWSALAQHPDTESVARVILRSARSGTSMADAMTDASAELRARADDAAAAAGERAGVLVSGPLGLCFLPAFVCLGIVPVVIGLAGSVLDGGVL